MKRLPTLLFAASLAACSTSSDRSRNNLHSTSGEPPVGRPDLRTVERIREYRVGRYVDPNDPFVMHDSHPVYRVERSAHWNLSAPSVQRTSTVGYGSDLAARDADLVSKHRTASEARAIKEQTQALAQKAQQLSGTANQTKELAKQNLVLRAELAEMQAKIHATEKRQAQQTAPSAEPEISRIEDTW